MSDPKSKIHNKSWLQKVAEQSWEPELLISGLAIYATLNLPQYVWKFYDYYTYNLQAGSGFIDELIPILVVGVLLTGLQALSFAFIFHFVVRAFWVGLMGLTSVYRDGIKYDDLQYSEYYRQEMKKRIGDKDSFLLAADKLASLIFSVASLFVLYLIGVMIIYVIFFLLMNGVKLMVSEETFDLYSTIILIVAGVFLFGIATLSIVLNAEKFRTQEKYAKLHFLITWHFSNLFYPFINKPIQFINLTFLSNQNMKKVSYYGAAYFAVFMVIFMYNTFQLMRVDLFEPRDFYSQRSTAATLDATNYESEFEGAYFDSPIIASPTIKRGDLLSVYIPYSKMMDKKLGLYCTEFSASDSLSRYERRKQRNEHNIECANAFFSVVINQEDTLDSDFLFYNHPKTNQAGFKGYYALSDSLNSGRNTVGIYRQAVDEADARRDSTGRLKNYEAEIPFWVEN
ncbi:MAG: hypothetical protein NXI08_08260 [bacterium]|nr:hypothetical protein [bacterium]